MSTLFEVRYVKNVERQRPDGSWYTAEDYTAFLGHIRADSAKDAEERMTTYFLTPGTVYDYVVTRPAQGQ